MSQSPLGRLDAMLVPRTAPIAIWLVGGLTGILMPVLLLIAGWSLDLLSTHTQGLASPNLRLGEWLVLPKSWIGGDASTLRGITVLLILFVFLAIAQAVLLWTLYRIASMRSIDKSVDLFRALFRKGGEQALVQSVSGQQAALRNAIQSDIPVIREAMLRWHRSMPRHVIQCVGCLLLSVLIQPLLTVLSMICLGLLTQLYRWMDQRRRTRLPVLRERATSALERVEELCQTGPLLASVHDAEATLTLFESSLRTYRFADRQLSFASALKTPVMLVAIALAIAMMGFVLSVRMIQSNQSMSIASSLTLMGSQFAAAVGLLRMMRMWSGLRVGRESAASTLSLLDQPVPTPSAVELQSMQGLRQELVLDHVTLKDSHGRKLLEDISTRMKPGQLFAIVSSDRLQARALAELVLGFGRPSSGRMMFDSALSTDLQPSSVRNQSVWIAPDGPLVVGSLEENLQPNGHPIDSTALQEAVRSAGLYEAIQNLSDGMATLVSPHDDRLQPDSLFRLGVARALLKKPSIVVAEEPTARVKMATESETFAALQQLTGRGMLVVVIPHRLSTLRQADNIIVIHEHRVVATGTHNQLLETSELYRHINYVRFSPLRHVSV